MGGQKNLGNVLISGQKARLINILPKIINIRVENQCLRLLRGLKRNAPSADATVKRDRLEAVAMLTLPLGMTAPNMMKTAERIRDASTERRAPLSSARREITAPPTAPERASATVEESPVSPTGSFIPKVMSAKRNENTKNKERINRAPPSMRSAGEGVNFSLRLFIRSPNRKIKRACI